MRHGRFLPNAVFAVILGGFTVLFAGCGIHGTWKTVSIEPMELAGKFRLARVTFDPDSTYTAAATYDDHSVTGTGQYTWDGMTLRLKPDDGDEREYRCILWAGSVLMVEHKIDDQTVTAKLLRQ